MRRLLDLFRVATPAHDDALASIADGSSGFTQKAQIAMVAQALIAQRETFDDLVSRALVRIIVGVVGTLASLAFLWDLASSWVVR